MNIVIYTPVEKLSERWFGGLSRNSSVFFATSLSDLDDLVGTIDFDLLLLHDRDLPLEKVQALRRRAPRCRIFILSDHPDEDKGLVYLQNGVVGYGNSYMNDGNLRAAVDVIAGGSVWINQSLMQKLINRTAGEDLAPDEKMRVAGERQRSVRDGALAALSNREFQIAGLVAQGLANLEIAASLGITERTVKAHLTNIFSKLSIRGRLNLALMINKTE